MLEDRGPGSVTKSRDLLQKGEEGWGEQGERRVAEKNGLKVKKNGEERCECRRERCSGGKSGVEEKMPGLRKGRVKKVKGEDDSGRDIGNGAI